MAEVVYTKNAPDAIGPYSQAMKVGNLVFTSGQIAINPATGNVEATTIEEQTHQVCKNLTNVLEAAGTSIGKAVKTVCFLKNMSDFGAFNGVYGEYFTSKPARSCVAAKELPKDVLVEVAYYLVVERLNFCFTEMRRPIIVGLYFKYFGRLMSPVVFL